MQTLGEILRSAREAKGVTASEAASATRIKVQHIAALESEEFEKIAAPIYVKGFLKLYAEYLELDPDEMIEKYKNAHAPLSPSQIVGDRDQQKSKREKKSSVRESLRNIRKQVQAKKSDRDSTGNPLADVYKRIRATIAKIELPPNLVRQALTVLGALLVLILIVSTIGNCASRRSRKSEEKIADQTIIEDIPEPYIEPEMMPRD